MADYAISRFRSAMRPPSWLQTRNGWLWGAVICLVTCDIVLRVVVKDEATSSVYARDFVTSQPDVGFLASHGIGDPAPALLA